MSALIGTIRTSNNCGDYEVLNQVEGINRFKIRFLNTGYEGEYTRSAISANNVRDRSLPKKGSPSKYGPGTFHQTNNYGILEVLETDGDLRKVRFINTGSEITTYIQQIAKGTVKDPALARAKSTPETNRKRALAQIKVKVGQVFKNNKDHSFEIMEIMSAKEVRIRFINTGYETIVKCRAIGQGEPKDVMEPSVLGHGFLGTEEKVDYRVYQIWKGMLQRVHTVSEYEDVTIHESWYNYSIFKSDIELLPNYDKWLSEGGRLWHFDKDILVPGNRQYGPTTVCFASAEDNHCDAMVRTLLKKHEVGSPVYNQLSSVIQALSAKYRALSPIYHTQQEEGETTSPL